MLLKIIKIALLFFPLLSTSQVLKTEQGYLIQKDDLIKLDFLARKGLECQKTIDVGLDLVDQLRNAKVISDSIANRLSMDLSRVEAATYKNVIEINKLSAANSQLKLSLAQEEYAHKKTKRNYRLTVGGISVGLISLLLLIK